jgi:hypothetical protein
METSSSVIFWLNETEEAIEATGVPDAREITQYVSKAIKTNF